MRAIVCVFSCACHTSDDIFESTEGYLNPVETIFLAAY